MKARKRKRLAAAVVKHLTAQRATLAAAGNDKATSDKLWKNFGKTKKRDVAWMTLVKTNGGTERCMYCEHDRGSAIDHFCPRAVDPALSFAWENWNLACSVCNSNFKRDQFPAGLLNPTALGYRFEDHFELEGPTGKLRLKTPEARSTEPVFSLNQPFLLKSRRNCLIAVQANIIVYGLERAAGNEAAAKRHLRALRGSPHRTVVDAVLRWHAGPQRKLLKPDCVAVLDAHPDLKQLLA